MMSSGISIDSLGAEPPAERRDEGFRPWHFFVLVSILIATVAVILARRSSPEHLILLSLTIAAVGAAAGAFYRMLAPLVAPAVSSVQAAPVNERTRAALQREKTLVLRSIKELEFDRAMGKVAEADFNEMAARLRARAIALMEQLDAGTSYRDMIERDLAARVGSDSKFPVTGTAPAADDRPAATCTCGTTNDADARFCKSCGAKIGGES
jgi:hypothetical protein